MNYNLFIARRLYRSADNKRRVSRPAISIATAGIALGLAVMIVSVCVVLGFKHEVMSKVTGFGSHIQVVNLQSLQMAESQPIRFPQPVVDELKSVRGVKHMQRYCEKAGMLKTDEAFRGVMLRGVGEEYDTTFLASHMVAGRIQAFSNKKQTNKILISQMLASQLRVGVGDRLYAYFFDDGVRARRFSIEGIYQTHMSEFDKNLVFTDLYACQKLAGWESVQYSGMEISVDDFTQLDRIGYDVAMALREHNDPDGAYYSANTIRKLYPNIFLWLSLLDTNVWVILALMVAVAAFTMISGLLIIILERTNFVGIMKALGATNGELRCLFLYFGVFIIGRALIIGNVIGLGLVGLQQYTGLVHLDPDTYYVDSVPMQINWLYIVLINIGTLLISVMVLIIPSYVVSHIHPAKSIRFE